MFLPDSTAAKISAYSPSPFRDSITFIPSTSHPSFPKQSNNNKVDFNMSSEYPRPDTTGGSSALRHILNVPKEILISIFAEFESLEATNHLIVELCQRTMRKNLAEELGQTISSARLVCRQFNDTASQFLIPVVLVKLNQESLNRMEEISRSPGIANGIRVVRVTVNCYLQMPAIRLSHFVGFKTLVVREHGSVEYDCISAWDRAALPNDIPVTEGSFVSQLAASIRRMPHFTSLEFVNYRTLVPDLDLHSMSDEAYQFLVEGNNWQEIEDVIDEWDEVVMGEEFKAETTPTILFVDLRVAIHKEGVILRDMHIRYFPIQAYNRRLIDPAGSEHELHTASQNLKHVTVGGIGYLLVFRDPSFLSFSLDSEFAELSLIANIRAILSRLQLKTVKLNPDVFTGEKGEISYLDHYPQDQVNGESFFLDAVIDRLIYRSS